MYQELALQIAQKAHVGQVDKAGKDYIFHPITVSSYMDTDTEKAIAYLHDVLEDTNVTVDELRTIFSNEIVDTVITLTHRKDESDFVGSLILVISRLCIRSATLTFLAKLDLDTL